MLGEDGGLKEKLLQEIMKIIQLIPDAEDQKDGGVDEQTEGEPALGADLGAPGPDEIKKGPF